MRRFLLLAVLGTGCVEAAGTEIEPFVADGKADGATAEIRVRASDMTVWVRPTALPETRDGQRVWVLRGRASRNLTEAFTYIVDDGFARAQVTGTNGDIRVAVVGLNSRG